MRVETRFFSELNDFLSRERRGRSFATEVGPGTTVKDLVESLGVPHTEVEVILVDDESVDFGHQVHDGDRVSVYPVFDAPDASRVIRLRPPPLRQPRFVLDVHLGRLARYLRLLGFDTVWSRDATDRELVATSLRDRRILLTRDRGLLKRKAVTHGYYLRGTDRRGQVLEVLDRFDLVAGVDPLTRCLECNGRLEPVARADVEDGLPPRASRDYEKFRRCPGCGRVYWEGSHVERLRALVDSICLEFSTQAAALAACSRGWSVVPLHSIDRRRCSCRTPGCPAPGKHPRVGWELRMHEAAGPDQLESWWRRWPRSNLGVVTGAVSGLVVIDIDPRHGGDVTLAELEAFHGTVPPTVEALTGGGGRHLYFRHPGLEVPSRPLAQGLDVKGDGGLVVAPPSVHRSGRTYRWKTGRAPGQVSLTDVPPWLLAVLQFDRGEAQPRRRALPPITARSESERQAFAGMWAELGIRLRPGDHNYLCPFHADHHPSLHIDWDGCRFYCFGCGRGGGASRLRRLLDGTPAHRPPVTVPIAAGGRAGAVSLAGATDVHVAGTSRHQDVLLDLTGGRRRYGGVHTPAVAHLVPEPSNGADPGAIAVRIAGRRVGYLLRADAARCRRRVAEALSASGEATCWATIVGGWERERGDVGHFGVRLSL